MPKYMPDMIAGYYLYFTSKCIIEAMHVHAGDASMSPATAAKLFVYENGDKTGARIKGEYMNIPPILSVLRPGI